MQTNFCTSVIVKEAFEESCTAGTNSEYELKSKHFESFNFVNKILLSGSLDLNFKLTAL